MRIRARSVTALGIIFAALAGSVSAASPTTSTSASINDVDNLSAILLDRINQQSAQIARLQAELQISRQQCKSLQQQLQGRQLLSPKNPFQMPNTDQSNAAPPPNAIPHIVNGQIYYLVPLNSR